MSKYPVVWRRCRARAGVQRGGGGTATTRDRLGQPTASTTGRPLVVQLGDREAAVIEDEDADADGAASDSDAEDGATGPDSANLGADAQWTPHCIVQPQR